MSWEQHLVNSQVNIGRAVFEMNRPGGLKTDSWYKEKPDEKYIVEQIKEGILELQQALKEIENTLF